MSTIDTERHLPHPGYLRSGTDLVQLRDVRVVFDGFTALDLPYFGVDRSELRVVIGPNGAGKTTLCDVISGKTRVTAGQVFFDDIDITSYDETRIASMGVGRKFQTPTVFDSLNVFENMELALPGRSGIWANIIGRCTADQRQRIEALLQRVGLLSDRHRHARYLSHGQRQWLEIAMLMISGPQLLLVDEPAAGLSDSETERTAELLNELKGDHTLIVIEHDMEFVRMLDSKVTVLAEGKKLAEGSLSEVSANEAVIEAYLGR